MTGKIMNVLQVALILSIYAMFWLIFGVLIGRNT